ncbi:chemotaxis protein CheB [Loktanella sp. DJP18]|uniref:chemotaxis protein CheB n=1 Tax=Loktanella sp. DJP18 TaxID=3409788 RepID=UPI003BB4DC9A
MRLFVSGSAGAAGMSVERVIAIGGSIGALAVLKQVLPQIPANLPAPIFVALHVGSQGRDLLADIFDQCAALPASTAVEGEPVRNGRIYVAPADRHLLIIDGVIRLGSGPRENMARPAIDALFRSVAIQYGAGSCREGGAGLLAIKQCGRLTVVQDPLSATAPEMPLNALEVSDIDHRVAPDDIAALITSLVHEVTAPNCPIPRALALEVDIALGQRSCLSDTIEDIADIGPLSCSACGGTLSQIKEAPLRYRCQVGHAYSAGAFSAALEGSLEEAVRVALRIVEERAVLLERMARDAETAGRARTGGDFAGKAAELRSSAKVLRSAALNFL